jgi:hypothetical protein
MNAILAARYGKALHGDFSAANVHGMWGGSRTAWVLNRRFLLAV